MSEFFCVECKKPISDAWIGAVQSRRSTDHKDDQIETCSRACRAKRTLKEYRARLREQKKAQSGNG